MFNAFSPVQFPPGTSKLSDAYKTLPEFSHYVPLELEVKIYNINSGHNEEIFAKSKTIKEYATFISKVRMFLAEKYLLVEALTKAVYECIEDGVLTNFLRKNSSEVINLLLQEWDQETCYKVSFMEGKEEGIEIGKLELVRRMLARNMPLDEIADISLLPIESIKALAATERS